MLGFTALTLNGEPQTFVQTLNTLHEIATQMRSSSADPATARALSMSITSIEEARTRYTEARARQLGCYQPADLDAQRNAADYAQAYRPACPACNAGRGETCCLTAPADCTRS